MMLMTNGCYNSDIKWNEYSRSPSLGQKTTNVYVQTPHRLEKRLKIPKGQSEFVIISKKNRQHNEIYMYVIFLYCDTFLE